MRIIGCAWRGVCSAKAIVREHQRLHKQSAHSPTPALLAPTPGVSRKQHSHSSSPPHLPELANVRISPTLIKQAVNCLQVFI